MKKQLLALVALGALYMPAVSPRIQIGDYLDYALVGGAADDMIRGDESFTNQKLGALLNKLGFSQENEGWRGRAAKWYMSDKLGGSKRRRLLDIMRYLMLQGMYTNLRNRARNDRRGYKPVYKELIELGTAGSNVIKSFKPRTLTRLRRIAV